MPAAQWNKRACPSRRQISKKRISRGSLKEGAKIRFLKFAEARNSFHYAAGESERCRSRLAAHGAGGLSAGFGSAYTRGYPMYSRSTGIIPEALEDPAAQAPNACDGSDSG